MKKTLFIAFTVALFSSCSNKSGKEANENDSISNDLIANPSTADNPEAKSENLAEMTFKTTEHNFGDILEHQKVETVFEFTNTGKVDLLINDCVASCGCTVPEWPRQAIKPGESGKIKVVFDSTGKAGTNNRNVTVKANIPEKQIVLTFIAKVREVKG
jgi:hypothetical protein